VQSGGGGAEAEVGGCTGSAVASQGRTDAVSATATERNLATSDAYHVGGELYFSSQFCLPCLAGLIAT